MELISRIKEAKAIPIVLADGTPDSVNLQGRGRITLPAGARLAPNKEHEIRSFVTVAGEATPGSETAGTLVEGNSAGHAFKNVSAAPTQKK
jgi:hypothetical protein